MIFFDRRKQWIFSTLLSLIFLCSAVRGEEFGFDIWTTANGLPQNTVTGLAQTPDGYLWLSTFDGLARFDGVRFTIFDKGNTKGILNNRFTNVFVDREGTLFAGTDNRIITTYRDGMFTSYSQLADAGEGIPYLKSDKDGNVIIETEKAEYYLQNGQFVPIPEQKVEGVKLTYFGKSGAEWVFEPNQISRIKEGQVTTYQVSLNQPGADSSLSFGPFEDSQGALWVTRFEPRQFVRLKDGVVSIFTSKEIPGWNGNYLTTAKEDADGSLRFFFAIGYPTKRAQYVRFKDNQFTTYQFNEIIGVSCGFVDREGNFWLGTTAGLRRLRIRLITNLSVKDGLNGIEVYPIFETAQGDILIGSTNGLNLYADGKITDLGVNLRPGLPILSSGLFSDTSNRLWVGFGGGFGRFENGSLKKLKEVASSATDFTSDQEGNVWISTDEGLFKYKGDKEIGHYTADDGLPNNNVVLTHQDRNGNLWAGTFDGIAVLKGERFADFKAEPDSPKGYVREIYEDADGVLWFGTYADGLYRYKDGKFFNYRVEHGLFNNGVFAVLEDERGNFWMSSNRGIYRVSKQELNDFAEGKIPKINSISYNEKDGMLNAECNGGRIPAAIKTRDGKLWFATMGGVAIVDPEAEQVNPYPPPVAIENISIDRKAADSQLLQSTIRNAQSAIDLQPGQSNIAIEYTGLSLTKSDQIKFRYKLEGLEENWVDAGTKRTVDYSYLPAGTYTFRVIAANGNGVWNTEGASIKVVVRPFFYRTWWFIGLLTLALVALVWWAYHTRVSRLKAISEAKTLFSRQLIESQEAERKRIASELHDGLGQSLVVIKNRAMLGIKKGDDQKRVAKELDSISESASQALDEVREITNNLRPQLLDRLGLTKAIESMVKKVSGLIDVNSEIDSIDGVFSEHDEISIYRIVQESLNNVIKHANATTVSVKIKRSSNNVLIKIRDNGKGFNVENPNSKSSGLGLVGLKERAMLLNGDFSIESEIGKGAAVEVNIKK